MYRTSKHWKLI